MNYILKGGTYEQVEEHYNKARRSDIGRSRFTFRRGTRDDVLAYGDVQEAEDIFTDELGLEPDYIVDLFM